MKNSELITFLSQFDGNMPIKILINSTDPKSEVVDLDEENILHTSETAYCDDNAPEEEWDTEDGKVMLGDGQQYLLFNPIIV
jgi:hypothetical protein